MPKSTPPPDAASDDSVLKHRKLAESGAAVQTLPRKPRRTFSVAEKLRIVQQGGGLSCLWQASGGVEAMLYKEGIGTFVKPKERGRFAWVQDATP